MRTRCDTKTKILIIERLFLRGKPLTVPKIIEKLDREFGITSERKSIYDDINVLSIFLPIVMVRKSGKTSYILLDENTD